MSNGGISVPRAIPSSSTGATVATRRVRVFLSRSPGAPGTPRGIENADWTLSNGVITTDFGRTGANGLITLQLVPGETAILNVLGTSYNITLRLDAIEAANTLSGVQRRLRLLGYQLGDSGPDGNGVHPSASPVMNVETNRAVLEFQADRNIKMDANVGPTTRSNLTAAAGA